MPLLLQSAKPSIWKKVLVLLIGIMIIAPDTWAQGLLHLYRLKGELIFNFRLFRSQGKDSRDEEAYTFEEQLRIGDKGYVLHPGILTFDVEVNPTFSQQGFKGEGVDSDSNTRILNYSVNLGILQARPFSLNVHGARNSGTLTSSVGDWTEFQTDSFQVVGTYKNPYFPFHMSYSKRFFEQTQTSGLTSAVFDRDEVEESLSFSGSNSKMDLFLERIQFEDRTGNRPFVSNLGRFSHRLLRWGKGSSLNYNIDYRNREGVRPTRGLAVGEQLHLQHTKNLYTTYSHTYTSFVRVRDTKSNSGAFSLNHKLYQNLNTRLNLSGSSIDSESNRQLSYGGGLNLSYTKKLPWKGRFTAGVGGAYRIEDNETPGALFEVVNEEHKVNSTRVFLLKRRFIVIDSIVITNPAETVVYIQEQDYDIVSSGSLTEIRIFTEGTISVGDVLSVDYLYESIPARKFSTTTFNYMTGLDFDWVYLYYRLFQMDQDLLSGRSGEPLLSEESSTTGVEFEFAGPTYRLTLTAEKESRKTGDFKFDTINLRQSYQHTFSKKISLSFDARQTFFDTEKSGSTTFSEGLSINWQPKPNLFLELNAEMWQREEREEDDKSEERVWKVGPKLRWFVGKTEINSEYSHLEWSGASGDRDEDRLTFTFKRRF